jgi:hydroxymethylbilane synthase
MRRLILGTRGSRLARRQSELALEALTAAAPGLEVETRVVRTEGDRRAGAPLEAIGGQGVFVKDIERRLSRGEIDIAVHSLKDMPPELPPGLTIGAVLPRGDARDTLAGRDGARLPDLPRGARIGTDSGRRAVQLRALRPDIVTASIRGNVDTRLRKLDAGEYDAVVLAAAGLERLGLLERATQVFGVDELLPAVGQGAIAIECRAEDTEVLNLLARLDHRETRLAVTAERSFLRRLGAGCRLPIGAYAEVKSGRLRLRALLTDDTMRKEEAFADASEALALGEAVAERLLKAASLHATRLPDGR